MSNLAELLSLCASTARADAPGNIYVSALQKSGGTAFGAWGAWCYPADGPSPTEENYKASQGNSARIPWGGSPRILL